jgi:hypothetical protein
MAKPFTTTIGTPASIGATVFSLPNGSTTLTAQTTPCELEVYVGLGNMIAGDQYRIQVLETVGGAQAVVWEATATGVQTGAVWVPPRRVATGWDVQVKLMAGSARTVGWTIHQDVGDRNALTISDGAVAAATLAAGALTAIAGSVWTSVSEGAERYGDVVRLIRSRLIGKATVQDGNGTYAFRDAADTKDRVVMARAGTARTTTTADGT